MSEQPDPKEVDQDVIYNTIETVYARDGMQGQEKYVSTAEITEAISSHIGGQVNPNDVYRAMDTLNFSTAPITGNVFWRVWQNSPG